jgi:hypothetical protein
MPLQPGIFTRIVLESLLALRSCSCPHHAGIIASIALSLSPALCRRCPPHCAGIHPPCHAGIFALVTPHIAASILNWCLLSPTAVVTCWGMWHCCCLLVIADGFVPFTGSLHSDMAFDGPANVALVSLPALRWHPCPHVASIIVSIALLLLPMLHRRCCPPCAGIFALVLLTLPISLHPHCRQHRKLASAQSQCSRNPLAYVTLSPFSSSLPVVLLLYLESSIVTGPLANAVLASLLVLHWRPSPRRAGVIASIALLLLLALRWHHCLHLTGVFALVALALPPLLPLHCHQHCKLASAQPQRSCDMSTYMALSSWSFSFPVALLSYPASFHGHFAFDGPTNAALASLPVLCFATRAGVIASIAPLLLPVLHRHCCPHCAGIVTLVTPALLPASQTGICPVMMQLRHNAGEALLLRTLSSPMASLLYTALVHRDLAFEGLAKAAITFSLALRLCLA